MKTSVNALSVLLAAVFFFFRPALGHSTDENSCVTCHTSEASLKALSKVPEIPKGEGEG